MAVEPAHSNEATYYLELKCEAPVSHEEILVAYFFEVDSVAKAQARYPEKFVKFENRCVSKWEAKRKIASVTKDDLSFSSKVISRPASYVGTYGDPCHEPHDCDTRVCNTDIGKCIMRVVLPLQLGI